MCTLGAPLEAAPLRVPYAMGFEAEEDAELANWHLNPGVQAVGCRDQWYVGEAVKSDGHRSMYISCDTARSAQFWWKPCLQYVYRDVELEPGTYDVSFDWLCVGARDAILQVGYGLASQLTLAADSLNGSMSAALHNYVAVDSLHGAMDWQNSAFSITASAGKTYRIFFAWATNNDNGDLPVPVGACIDNVQITSAACRRPTALKAERLSCDSMLLSWSGTASEYELSYRKVGGRWHTTTHIEGGASASLLMDALEEGAYDFRVRGVCGADTSAWNYLNRVVNYCAEAHRLDYVTLDKSLCTYGTTPNSNSGVPGYSLYKDSAYAHVGRIDYGPDSRQSRHTVIWDQSATDPRTGNQLRCIADGALASVRLGNWQNGNGAEAIAYSYTVDSMSSLLLIKYAVVMQDPNHEVEHQPRFILEVLGKNGQLLDECTYCNFVADRNKGGWRNVEYAGETVVYKPWTLVGVNLEKFIGLDVTLRLTTYDCFEGMHWGYAYYSLDCAEATLKTVACVKNETMTLRAPDGFSYSWTDYRGKPVSEEQSITVLPNDTMEYSCFMGFLGNADEDGCGFSLSTKCRPSMPVPDFDWRYVPRDCRNRVEFTNKSHIQVKVGDALVDQDKACEDYEWSFGYRGQTSDHRNPYCNFPAEGGTFDVTLTAWIAEGQCEESVTKTITVPAIEEHTEVMDTTVCEGTELIFGDRIITTAGVYTIERKTLAGCDSSTIYNVYMGRRDTTHLPNYMHCASDGPYCVDGDCYEAKESGVFVRTLTGRWGCDSIVRQYVTLTEPIDVEVHVTPISVEAQQYRGEVHFTAEGVEHYWFGGQHYVGATGDFTGLRPGYYELSLLNREGCSVDTTIVMYGDPLRVRPAAPHAICAGDVEAELPLAVEQGVMTTYSMAFDDAAHKAGFVDFEGEFENSETGDSILVEVPAEVAPNRYHARLTLHDPIWEDVELGVELVVNYPREVIYMRWNKVLSLVSDSLAGYDDYAFVEYQWYCNGQAIEGATRSFYASDALQMDAEYSVALTRKDGVKLATCAFRPSEYTDPHKVSETPAYVRIYNVLGWLVAEGATINGSYQHLLPETQGYYIAVPVE